MWKSLVTSTTLEISAMNLSLAAVTLTELYTVQFLKVTFPHAYNIIFTITTTYRCCMTGCFIILRRLTLHVAVDTNPVFSTVFEILILKHLEAMTLTV